MNEYVRASVSVNVIPFPLLPLTFQIRTHKTHQASRIYLFSSFYLTFPSIKNGLPRTDSLHAKRNDSHEVNLIRILGNVKYELHIIAYFLSSEIEVHERARAHTRCTNKRFIFSHLRRVSRNVSSTLK